MLCTPDGQSQTGLERVGTLSHQGALRTGLNFLCCDVYTITFHSLAVRPLGSLAA